MKKTVKYGYVQKQILAFLKGGKARSFDQLYQLVYPKEPRYPRSYLTPTLLRMVRYDLIQVDWEAEIVKLGDGYDKRTITRHTK